MNDVLYDSHNKNLEDNIKEAKPIIDYTRQDFEFYSKVQKKSLKIVSLFHNYEFIGTENLESIIDGPAIIVSNHPEAYKDVLLIAEMFLRQGQQLFFGARSELFNHKKFDNLIRTYLKKHIHILSHLVRNDYVERFAKFSESNLSRIGTIPIDINTRKYQETFEKMARCIGEYDQKLVLLQYDQKMSDADKHSIFHGVKKGASVVVNLAYKRYGKDVPVVPIAIYGSKGFIPFSHLITTLKKKSIKLKVGKPIYITSFLEEGTSEKQSIENMRQALEKSIWGLIRDLVRIKK